MRLIQNYLREILGEDLQLVCKNREKRFPLYLTASYDIFRCDYREGAFYLLVEKGEELRPIRSLEKHCAWLRELVGLPVAYAAAALPNYKVSRLLKKRVPFIIPGLRAHLPFVGILMGRVRTPGQKPPSATLGFKAQQVLLAYLNRAFGGDITVPSICALFGYSRVTATRIMDEIEATGLAKRVAVPSTRQLGLKFFREGRALWDELEPKLQNPVRTVIPLATEPVGQPPVLSGESALADCTMLARPATRHVACFFKGDEFQRLKAVAVPMEEAEVLAEAWRYEPLLPGRKTLDPLSIWLTTREIASDERVQAEREAMLEEMIW